MAAFLTRFFWHSLSLNIREVDITGLRSQLLTFIKAYTAYTRGEGVWDHRTLSPRKSTFIFNHWQWQYITKYGTQNMSIIRSRAHLIFSIIQLYSMHTFVALMYNNPFKALFLTSKCMRIDFLFNANSGATTRFLYGRPETLPFTLILVHKSHQTTNSSLIIY